VRPPYKEGPDHMFATHPSQKKTTQAAKKAPHINQGNGATWEPFPGRCFLTVLVMLFAAWYALDFVPTPYELKQWPRLTIPPLLATGTMCKMIA